MQGSSVESRDISISHSQRSTDRPSDAHPGDRSNKSTIRILEDPRTAEPRGLESGQISGGANLSGRGINAAAEAETPSVHPGSTTLVAAFAAVEEAAASSQDLITAFVAGCECMFRIALAAKSTSEKLGFHAPGLTGVFGQWSPSAKSCGCPLSKHL
jgi:MmgE/PrpD N-terminal domain